ncbi:MAG TPA: hypothetical protein VFX30_03485 [bacterium]|nr:hypothetical protein [bacterium]
MKITFFLLVSFFWIRVCLALSPPIGCGVEKLPGQAGQSAAGWNVSIVKENQRKKSGDAFVAVEKASGKRCELELPSWGETLYSAHGKGSLFIVEQGDASYTTLTWIEPNACKIVKTLSEYGAVKIVGASVIFPGGKDGPGTVLEKRFPLNTDCLP